MSAVRAADGRWLMHAHDRGDHFEHFGAETYVRLHHMPFPIVKVEVIEDATGGYWGWLPADGDSPTMIWPTRALFEMCFPYGSSATADTGRVVRLRAEAVDDEG